MKPRILAAAVATLLIAGCDFSGVLSVKDSTCVEEKYTYPADSLRPPIDTIARIDTVLVVRCENK